MVVVLDFNNREEHVIVNDPKGLEELHEKNRDEIWVGYNNTRYDQFIHKAILCGFNPKEVNDFIIEQNEPGWKFSRTFRKIQMYNYDVMVFGDGGLKTLEGYMGHDIRESTVAFDIDRKLTDEEIEDVIRYCKHDVQETVEVFLERKGDFEKQMGLVRLASEETGLNLNLVSRTNAQLSAIILNARKRNRNDEFELEFPETLEINKYKHVLEWYENPDNRTYFKDGKKNQLETKIAGVPHVFGWGGLHGAKEKYHKDGFFILMDVGSMYPSLMIEYDLLSRNVKDPSKFERIYDQRMKLKAAKDPAQEPLKLVLNTTYGAMKDKNNMLYDPLMANMVCVYGQLFLVDLIEMIEPYGEIVQSNTDGVLIRLHSEDDFDTVDDIAYEWEQRTGLNLDFELYKRVVQKDVNNYVAVEMDDSYVSKGGYVKKLNSLDNDLPIVNQALINYIIEGKPVEQTVYETDDLMQFQMVAKLTRKYSHFLLNGERIPEGVVRTFASSRPTDGGLQKVHRKTKKPAKFQNSPEKNFLYNDNVENVKVPDYLDKDWYIDMAKRRLEHFGLVT